MKALLCLIAPLLFSSAAFAMYARPDLEDVPLQRLLGNLTKLVAAEPRNADAHHHLARTHAMAYARKLDDVDKVESWKGWQGKAAPQPWFGYEHAHVPFRVVDPTDDAGKKKAAATHLETAIESYRKALALKPGDIPMMLGLAWCQEQSGDTKAAVAGYRGVIAAAWKKESKSGGGLGTFVVVETAGYLVPLLDAKKDAAEIADLEEKKKTLLALPRAVTPIIVPVTAGRTALTDLVDFEARVRFDLDGSGRQLEWPWITARAAWLVHDPRGTGSITSAIQMFGSRSFLLFCNDGYEALALLDDDRDGVLTGPELAGLALWQDADGDGVSTTGEVRSLADHGITGLSTRSEQHRSGMPYAPAGVTFRDGTSRPSYDLVVVSQPGERAGDADGE